MAEQDGAAQGIVMLITGESERQGMGGVGIEAVKDFRTVDADQDDRAAPFDRGADIGRKRHIGQPGGRGGLGGGLRGRTGSRAGHTGHDHGAFEKSAALKRKVFRRIIRLVDRHGRVLPVSGAGGFVPAHLCCLIC